MGSDTDTKSAYVSLGEEEYHAVLLSWGPHPYIEGYLDLLLRDEPGGPQADEWTFPIPVLEVDLHVGDRFTVWRDHFLVTPSAWDPDPEPWESSYMCAWRLNDGPRISVEPHRVGDLYM